ncbi:MAG: hypothetical protein ACLFRX_08430, partial [Gemmatimonadota bacterium]
RPRRARQGVGVAAVVLAAALALTALVVAGANAWVLYAYIVPALPAPWPFATHGVDGLVVPAAFAGLSFLLGLAYFTLTAPGRKLGLRVLGGLVVLAVAAQAALEAAAVVVALEALNLVDPTWWGGIAAAVLLGGAAALVPPTVASLAHAAIEQLERWVAASQQRAVGRELVERDQIASRVRESLDGLAGAVESIRSEVLALEWEPAGKLLLGSDTGSVNRLMTVLRRVASSIDDEVDRAWADRPGAAVGTARILADTAVLIAWVAAAGGAAALSSRGLVHAVATSSSVLVTGGTFAALATLIVSGLLLRTAGELGSDPPGPLVRGSSVLLIGLASASFAYALGSLAAGAGAFDGQVLLTAAWLNILVLVAAVASVRLREGIGAVASAVTLGLSAAALLVLTAVDGALALLDRALVGLRRQGPFTRRAARRTGAHPATGALGWGRRMR